MGDSLSSNKLFRQEVIDYKKNKWLGDALLISTVPSWLILIASIFTIVLLLIFIVFGQYSRRINVQGEVVTDPYVMNIFSPSQGFIVKVFVSTGQFVRQGQPLYEIDVSQNTPSGNVSISAQKSIEKQLNNLNEMMNKLNSNKIDTAESLKIQLEKYRQANKKSNTMLSEAQKGVEQMRKMADDYNIYLKQGLVTREQVNNLRYLYYEQESAVENLNNQILQENIQINDLSKQITIRSADFDNQILQFKVQSSDLERQLAQVRATGNIIVNAPQAGYIESIATTKGEMVSVGDNLVQLSPNKQAQYLVILWLPNNSIPFIRVGDAVNLRYDAFPYEKFGQFSGKISTISKVPASNNELTHYGSAPKNANASFYKIIIKPAKNNIIWQGKQLHITSGMQTQATLFLEKRPLYQWILSPFYDVQKSVTGIVHE